MKRMVFLIILLALAASAGWTRGSQDTGTAGAQLVAFTWDTDKADASLITTHIAEFEKRTGAKVSMTLMGLGDVAAKAATIFAAKSDAVDIIATWRGSINQFAAPGYLDDVTDKLDKSFVGGMTPALSSFKYKGRIYGLPYMQSFRFFYYNKKMFRDAGLDPEKPPATWAEAVAMGKKLTRDTNGDGKVDQWGLLPTGLGNADTATMDFQLIYYLCGGNGLFDENDVPVFNSPTGVRALKFYKGMYDAGVVDPASWTITSGNDRRARWITGVTGMVIEWPALWKMANTSEASKVKGDVGLAVIPAIDRIAGVSGDEGMSVSAFSKKKSAALEFVKFIASTDVNKENTVRVGWLPVQQSVMSDPSVQGNPSLLPMIKVAQEQNKYYMDRFAAPYSTEVQAEALFVAIVKAVKGEMSAEDALAWAAQKSKEIVATYKK
jgi:multiple sugar transport system substrate-binding protein